MWFFIVFIIAVFFVVVASVLRRIWTFLTGNIPNGSRFDPSEEDERDEMQPQHKTKKFSKDVGEYVNYEDVKDKKE